MMKTTRNKNIPQDPFSKALKYISYKNRSLKEVAEYLKKNDYSSEQIKDTLEKLMDYKFVDDEKFSEVFIRNKQYKGKSKKLISYELKQKGINKELSESALENADEDLITAKNYIKKRISQFSRLDPEKRKQRIVGRLQSRGYSWDVIKEVLKQINEATDIID